MPSNKITDRLIPGKYYHVYNRGNEKTRIFYSESNYRFFLERYSYYLSDWVETYAYCLIPNHFHLLIKVKESVNPAKASIVSQQFRKFFCSYAMAINNQQNRRGSLFHRPFRRHQINSNWQLKRTVYYIHNNPVKHRLTLDYKSFKYSSYQEIISERSELIEIASLISLFNDIDEFVEYHEYFSGK